MMIVMKETATDEEVDAVVAKIEKAGARPHRSRGARVTVIGAIGDVEQDASVESLGLEGQPGVDRVVPILKPYKLASAQFMHGERTVLDIDGRKVGGDNFALIAGPCTVESREVTLQTARIVRDAGATLFRGGAYKPRTSPYAFQGLGQEGLRLLAEAKAETGLPIVTELMDVRDIDAVLEVADVIQVGARNMQNYPLLAEIGRAERPVLLKRGLSAPLDELLMAAEYVLKEGNPAVMLCERGIRTFETDHRRVTLDLMAVPILKELTHLPVTVDPRHGARRAGAEVCGFDPDAGVGERALALGAIGTRAVDLPSAVAGADFAFVAVPVGVLAQTVRQVLARAGPQCVVSDVGSTKRVVADAGADERFIGGHPLAGAETAGLQNAREDLFEGATWYLTPARGSTAGVLYERLHGLLRSFGAKPVAIEALEHDRVLACVSHLPHVLANVLTAQAEETVGGGEQRRLPAVGPSFRDWARVAGANSAIWTDIYIANRDALAA